MAKASKNEEQEERLRELEFQLELMREALQLQNERLGAMAQAARQLRETLTEIETG